jgi:Asp-tRNA(Asn)/Glu-tRNA(Gln) amidotransferase A subunit family amidase
MTTTPIVDTPLNEMSAMQMAAEIRSGRMSSEQLVRACLDRIAEREGVIHAWAFLDPQRALDQARALDRAKSKGSLLGPLHGIPVGIKDIIDTADMPTENGTILHKGRQPKEDAAVVSLLRSAGAVVMGKTVTTEMATYSPAKTRNPRNPDHTPGGSSSGSAAAVAAGMVPLAVGTQTNGSVIRPASFCGVVGFKPTYGMISRRGILAQSRALDQVGVFARTVDDAGLIAQQLMVFDSGDSGMRHFSQPPFHEPVMQGSAQGPSIAFVKSPAWHQIEDPIRALWSTLVTQIGDRIDEIDLPAIFHEAVPAHQTIVEADIARSYAEEYRRGAGDLSTNLRETIERGQKIPQDDYERALKKIPLLDAALEGIFNRYDAILTPATSGQAPRSLESTGSPVFCTLWTLCGVPAITLPLMEGPDRLPVGVQLIGQKHRDGRLLRTATWLTEQLAGE